MTRFRPAKTARELDRRQRSERARASAAARTCPECNRRAALKKIRGTAVMEMEAGEPVWFMACSWNDCDYESDPA